MAQVKTSNLQGEALDYAVALCEGFRIEVNHQYTEEKLFAGWWQCGPHHWQPLCAYSTSWAQGGPIIECIKGFSFKQWLESRPESCCEAHIHNYAGNWVEFGPTPLIAAMRCYVASKLGDVVSIPDELM